MASVAMAGLVSVRFPTSSSSVSSSSSSPSSSSSSASISSFPAVPSFSSGCSSFNPSSAKSASQYVSIRKESMIPVVHALVAQVLTTESPLEIKVTKDGDGEDGGTPSSGLKLESEADILKKKQKRAELRRKRLVRKRHLRKKGRWPPSKMAKLKNV